MSPKWLLEGVVAAGVAHVGPMLPPCHCRGRARRRSLFAGIFLLEPEFVFLCFFDRHKKFLLLTSAKNFYAVSSSVYFLGCSLAGSFSTAPDLPMHKHIHCFSSARRVSTCRTWQYTVLLQQQAAKFYLWRVLRLRGLSRVRATYKVIAVAARQLQRIGKACLRKGVHQTAAWEAARILRAPLILVVIPY
eukprot:s132_g19.t1